jgi:ribosomal protein S10
MVFEGVEIPAKVKLTNLGVMKSDTNLLSLKYECELAATNFTAALNDFIEKTTKETGLKSAGPITNAVSFKRSTILEVQTERKTLKPHWAKRILTTTVSAPGEAPETASEVHEYKFLWDGKAHLN